MNKNIVRIIYGAVVAIVIILAFFIYSKKREMNNTGSWQTYKNEELNIETKLPEGVEVEIEK